MARIFPAFCLLLFVFLTKTTAQEAHFIEFDSLDWRAKSADWPQIDSIGNPDSLSEDQLRQWAARLDQQADLLKKGFERELQYATYKRENLQGIIAKLKKSPSTPDTVYLSNTILFSRAKQSEKMWKQLVDRAKKIQSNTSRLKKMPVAGLRRAVVTNEVELRQLLNDGNLAAGNRPKTIGPAVANPADPPVQKVQEPGKQKSGELVSTEPMVEKPVEIAQKPVAPRQKATKLATDYKMYSRTEDPLLTPPATKCRFANQSRDEFTGAIHSEVAPEPFFTFTNSFMRNHLGDKPHIVCDVHLSGLSTGSKFVQMNFRINEGSAKRSFGGLKQGNKMTIKFIDGSVIQLENARTDEGEVNDTDNFTTFQGLYLIEGKEQLAAIKKREIDRIRIGWNTGFEDYEVYNVDVLKRQAGCIF